MRKAIGAVIAGAMLVVLVAAPAGADPQGNIEEPFEYGYFYGTFNQSPNVVLFAGGTIGEFCFGDPGTARSRVVVRDDGTVHIGVNDKDQPIYLYYTDFNDAPTWLDDICPGIVAEVDAPPEFFASGTADLTVRISILPENLVDVFNSVNGTATGIDGTEYKVSASADLIVENGIPLGNPEEFIRFRLKEIKN